jgi:hypothetical protein
MKYEIGQIVYLKTDPDQYERMIIARCERQNNYYEYELAFGSSLSWHCEMEISSEKNMVKALS